MSGLDRSPRCARRFHCDHQRGAAGGGGTEPPPAAVRDDSGAAPGRSRPGSHPAGAGRDAGTAHRRPGAWRCEHQERVRIRSRRSRLRASQLLVLRSTHKAVHPHVAASRTFTQVFPSHTRGIARQPMSTTGNAAPLTRARPPGCSRPTTSRTCRRPAAPATPSRSSTHTTTRPPKSDLDRYRAKIRAAAVHNRKRLLHEGQRERQQLAAAGARTPVGGGDRVSIWTPSPRSARTARSFWSRPVRSWSELAQGVQTAASWPGVIAGLQQLRRGLDLASRQHVNVPGGRRPCSAPATRARRTSGVLLPGRVPA